VTTSPTEALNGYVRAFETLDPQNFASYYNRPCIFINPGGITAATDAGAVQALAESIVAQARRYDFKRTEVVGPLDCQMLPGTLAMLSGVFRRFDSADHVILDSGFTYVMQSVDDRWKIVVAAAYSPRG
jgi:hypothetical protein